MRPCLRMMLADAAVACSGAGPLFGNGPGEEKAGERRLSGQEFYAIGPAATPNDLAQLSLRVPRHKRQFELVPDIHRIIGRDPGAARRDVHDEAFALRRPVIDRDPGRLLLQLPSRFALYLRPRLHNSHDDHPLLDLAAIVQAIVKAGRQPEADPVKVLLAHCLGI